MKIEPEKNEAVLIMPVDYPHEECPIDTIREILPLEEIADVKLCLHVAGFEAVRHKIQVNRTISTKAARWLKRLLGEEA